MKSYWHIGIECFPPPHLSGQPWVVNPECTPEVSKVHAHVQVLHVLSPFGAPICRRRNVVDRSLDTRKCIADEMLKGWVSVCSNQCCKVFFNSCHYSPTNEASFYLCPCTYMPGFSTAAVIRLIIVYLPDTTAACCGCALPAYMTTWCSE